MSVPHDAPVDLNAFLSTASFWLPDRIVKSAWLGHAPFAFWLIGALRPALFVELGTHHGFSYLAFCQAVRTLNLTTRCFAIDTWTGDPQSGHYPGTVYEALATYHDPLFADFSRLVRARFDEAAPSFTDGSIDLLHIDGRHDEASVRADYELWRHKMSDRGVILFHDISVRKAEFGVWRLWDELIQTYPHFTFTHGYGLGVLGYGRRLPDKVDRFLAAARQHGDAIRQCYHRLGAGIGDQQARTLPTSAERATGSRTAATPRSAGLHIHLAALAPDFLDVRTTLPLRALAAHPAVTASLSTRAIDLPPLPASQPKILILQRMGRRPVSDWQNLLPNILSQGWIVVSEFDDHPELIAAVNRQPVNAESWNAVRFAHGVQTATPSLCEAIQCYNPETVTFENAAFTVVPDAVEPRADGVLRVFFGALNRGAVSARLAACLAPVAASRPQIEFVVVHDRAFFDALGDLRKSFSSALPYAEYLDLMGGCDVALIPMAGGQGQQYKSDIKFVEASSRGLASIVSPMVYARTVRHGETGLIVQDFDAWGGALASLYEDRRLRRALARAARDYVVQNRMFSMQAGQRIAWYQSLWTRRLALNDGLVQRLVAPVL